MAAELRVEIFAQDLDAFVDFYTRVLAFIVSDDRRSDSDPYVVVQRERIRIGASLVWKPPVRDARLPPTGVEIVVEVDDDAFDGEVTRVIESGWPWSEEPQRRSWGLTDFRILDPDGYYVRVTDRGGVN